jgi:hypothetical protein
MVSVAALADQRIGRHCKARTDLTQDRAKHIFTNARANVLNRYAVHTWLHSWALPGWPRHDKATHLSFFNEWLNRWGKPHASAWNSAGYIVRSASSFVKNYDIAPPATGLVVDMAL